MAVRKTKRRGKRVLVIDFIYTTLEGKEKRYRRDAKVQTQAAADAEFRRRLAAAIATGSADDLPVIQPGARREVREEKEAPPEPKGPTFREVAQGYFDHFAPSHLKPPTVISYRKMVERDLMPWFGDKPISAINAAMVREYDTSLVRKGLMSGTRRVIQCVLRSVVCRYAVEAGYLPDRPKMPPLPKKSLPILNVLSREEVDRLLAASCPAYRLAFLLAAFAGLRLGEVRGLRMRDVNLAAGRLIVRRNITRAGEGTPKSGCDRIVPIAAVLRDALVQLGPRPLDARVSVNTMGKTWSDGCLGMAFKRTAKRAGLDKSWHFHDLRHFFVTQLFLAGVSAPTVQKLAGHVDLATTQRYAHVVPLDLDAAIEKLDAARARAGNLVETAFRAA